jgi:subtilisin family serine protease
MRRLLIGLGAALASIAPVAAGAGADTRSGGSALPVVPKRAVADELLVGFQAGVSEGAQDRVANKVNGVAAEDLVEGARRVEVELIELPRGASEAAAVRSLEASPAVAYAERNWRLGTLEVSTDTYYSDGRLWGMYGDRSPSRVNAYGSQAAEVWNSTRTGRTGDPNVVVGVIDEGIMVGHPDLDANVWRNSGEVAGDGVDNDGNGYVDDVNGWDFAAEDNTVFDGNPPADFTTDEHGTHVAGTIGAEANGTGVVGANWRISMVSGKFLGAGGGTTADAIQAVDYMTALKTKAGVNLVATNNSWGGGGYSQALHDAIIRGAKAGILFIAAAGNDGLNNDRWASYPANYNTTKGTSTQTPASYDAVISVAAINSGGGRPYWSNYGATTVDIGAPGAGINSTVPPDSSGTAYWTMSGTSMAAPHVTGGAALYKATHPTATAAQIRNALLGSAIRTNSMYGRTVTGGRLDINAALAR